MAIGNLKLEDYLPLVRENDGLYTENDIETTGNLIVGGTVAITGTATFTDAVSGPRPTEAVTADAETVSASESGKCYVQTRSSTTVTFTLPAATAGLWYSFVCGHADSEILITPQTGDAIVGKTHGAENGTGIAPAAGTGIKNTAATNVVGDFCTLVALDTTTWYMVAVAGVWASQ